MGINLLRRNRAWSIRKAELFTLLNLKPLGRLFSPRRKDTIIGLYVRNRRGRRFRKEKKRTENTSKIRKKRGR